MMRSKLKHFENLDMLYILKGYKALSTCDLTFGDTSYSYANALVFPFYSFLIEEVSTMATSFCSIINDVEPLNLLKVSKNTWFGHVTTRKRVLVHSGFH
jgi:hypothetical protein